MFRVARTRAHPDHAVDAFVLNRCAVCSDGGPAVGLTVNC